MISDLFPTIVTNFKVTIISLFIYLHVYIAAPEWIWSRKKEENSNKLCDCNDNKLRIIFLHPNLWNWSASNKIYFQYFRNCQKCLEGLVLEGNVRVLFKIASSRFRWQGRSVCIHFQHFALALSLLARSPVVTTNATLTSLRLRTQCFEMCSRVSVCLFSPNRSTDPSTDVHWTRYKGSASEDLPDVILV
jgi:hypothetical protein